ncbi:MAG: 3,4-dihydroxy-2-butanone 4-phosphate synthase (EC [uncultured Paraburkholderia sp.]|nr:MAG: 3,4-dihydroxy-2-butanone 4-phosphate synthase (EC [uncultured Paraburkholderia sp.]CAH2941626.1 MAG: 3,4-dihydroxy-2-butanone 4-phosphate synthase (EC [uncultured Paraburkholderia sp.]
MSFATFPASSTTAPDASLDLPLLATEPVPPRITAALQTMRDGTRRRAAGWTIVRTKPI